MKVVRHKIAAELLSRAGAWLERAEVENNLILGIAAYFASYTGELKTQPYFLTIEDNATIVGAALMSPPRQLLITSMPDPAVVALADHMLAESAPVPGVVGVNSKAELFAKRWTDATGQSSRIRMSDRLYSCTAVFPLSYASGRMRAATSDDHALLSEWSRQFCIDAQIEDEILYFIAQLPNMIAKGALFVWENDEIFSMAGVQREMLRGVAISWVFTPSHLRGQGYATACVAALTQRMLDGGKTFCCLYADLANPTSNNIYQKIGYKPMGDVQHWVFE